MKDAVIGIDVGKYELVIARSEATKQSRFHCTPYKPLDCFTLVTLGFAMRLNS